MRWQALILGVGILIASTPFAGAREAIDHSAWNALLQRYVRGGSVDYQGLAADRQALDAYLATLREADVHELQNRDDQLVFWINAYNASVIKGVLDHYPLKSVKDIDGLLGSLSDADHTVIDRVGRPGSSQAKIGFIHPASLGGLLVHLVQREELS